MGPGHVAAVARVLPAVPRAAGPGAELPVLRRDDRSLDGRGSFGAPVDAPTSFPPPSAPVAWAPPVSEVATGGGRRAAGLVVTVRRCCSPRSPSSRASAPSGGAGG